MKKTFQKTLIAAAAGVALMSAVGTASANSLLFPYFTTATGAQSVLSLYSGEDNTTLAGQAGAVHYVYNYGSSCTHYDAYGKLTANDILTHSIAATSAGGFGKAVSSDTSVPVYFPLSGQTGFLVVTERQGTGTTTLQGSMAIVDPSSGLVVSYAGITNALATDAAANAANEGKYDTVITDNTFALASLPSSLVTTSWYAVVAGDMYTAINTGADWTGAITLTNQGNIYNNDEVAYSGTKTKKTTCAGSIVASDLMTDAQVAAVGSTGSLIKASNTAASSAAASGLVMMKMQAVQAAVGAPFAGKQFLHREVAGY